MSDEKKNVGTSNTQDVGVSQETPTQDEIDNVQNEQDNNVPVDAVAGSDDATVKHPAEAGDDAEPVATAEEPEKVINPDATAVPEENVAIEKTDEASDNAGNDDVPPVPDGVDVSSTTPEVQKPVANETKQVSDKKKHDPLVLGLSIAGVVLGAIAMLVSCAGNAVVLRLSDQVNAMSIRQSERDWSDLSLDAENVINDILKDSKNDANSDSTASKPEAGEGYIGVRVTDYGDGGGARIVAMALGGAAYDAELRTDDVIIKFGDTKVTDAATLTNAVRNTTPGDTVTVAYVRDGKTLTANVKVGDGADMTWRSLGE